MLFQKGDSFLLDWKKILKIWFCDFAYSLWPTVLFALFIGCIVVVGKKISEFLPLIVTKIGIGIVFFSSIYIIMLIQRYALYKALRRPYRDFHLANLSDSNDWKFFGSFFWRYAVLEVIFYLPIYILDNVHSHRVVWMMLLSHVIHVVFQIIAFGLALNATVNLYKINVNANES